MYAIRSYYAITSYNVCYTKLLRVQHLDRYGLFIRNALGLKAKHARQLPFEIRDLSATLTDERDDFAPDYMTRPGPLAAYVHYFHPWNLYRLTRLFAGLPLTLPDNAIIADLGAGPLTVATALWLARPDLRRKPLRLLCLDRITSYNVCYTKLLRENHAY